MKRTALEEEKVINVINRFRRDMKFQGIFCRLFSKNHLDQYDVKVGDRIAFREPGVEFTVEGEELWVNFRYDPPYRNTWGGGVLMWLPDRESFVGGGINQLNMIRHLRSFMEVEHWAQQNGRNDFTKGRDTYVINSELYKKPKYTSERSIVFEFE